MASHSFVPVAQLNNYSSDEESVLSSPSSDVLTYVDEVLSGSSSSDEDAEFEYEETDVEIEHNGSPRPPIPAEWIAAAQPGSWNEEHQSTASWGNHAPNDWPERAPSPPTILEWLDGAYPRDRRYSPAPADPVAWNTASTPIPGSPHSDTMAGWNTDWNAVQEEMDRRANARTTTFVERLRRIIAFSYIFTAFTTAAGQSSTATAIFASAVATIEGLLRPVDQLVEMLDIEFIGNSAINLYFEDMVTISDEIRLEQDQAFWQLARYGSYDADVRALVDAIYDEYFPFAHHHTPPPESDDIAEARSDYTPYRDIPLTPVFPTVIQQSPSPAPLLLSTPPERPLSPLAHVPQLRTPNAAPSSPPALLSRLSTPPPAPSRASSSSSHRRERENVRFNPYSREILNRLWSRTTVRRRADAPILGLNQDINIAGSSFNRTPRVHRRPRMF